MNPIDPVQRLLAIADRERNKRTLAPAGTPAKRQPPSASVEDAARWHQRCQQALVAAARAGQEPDLEAQAELAWFARLGMTEADALAYLLRKYPAADAG